MTSRLTRSLLLLVAGLTGCSTQTTSLDEFELFFRFRANGTLVDLTSSGDFYGVFVEEPCGG